MNVAIGTEAPIFLFWEYLFQIFGILSLQCVTKFFEECAIPYFTSNLRGCKRLSLYQCSKAMDPGALLLLQVKPSNLQREIGEIRSSIHNFRREK